MPDLIHGWIQRPLAAVIEITGEDSADFLQSQFSADLRISDGQFSEGLWLNHRARIEGESFVLKLEDEKFLLLSRSTPVESLYAKLDRHIISEEMELEDITLQWEAIFAFLPSSHLETIRLFVPETETENVFVYQNGYYAISEKESGCCFVFLAGEKSALKAARAILEEVSLPELNEASFKRQRIESLQADIPSEIGSEETPSEAGLSHLCSLQKGCYLGQEVVNRQARLERTVKRFVKVRLAVEPVVNPEKSLEYPKIYTEDHGEVGELRTWTNDEGLILGLAMVRTKALGEALFLEGKGGPQVEVQMDD